MKDTGKINRITKDKILQIEESDINFWETDWDDLSLEQKADFCSFIQAPFLGNQNNDIVKDRYEYFQLKNNTPL